MDQNKKNLLLFAGIIIAVLLLFCSPLFYQIVQQDRQSRSSTNSDNSQQFTKLPEVSFKHFRGGEVSTEHLKGSIVIIHFFYSHHEGFVYQKDVPLLYEPENTPQMEALETFAHREGIDADELDDRNWSKNRDFNIVTIAIPKICCQQTTIDRIFIEGDKFPLENITWFAGVDEGYSIFTTYYDYIGAVGTANAEGKWTEQNLLYADPTILILDPEGYVVYLSGYTSVENLTATIEKVRAEQQEPIAPRERTSFNELYITMPVLGFLSLLAPCCLAMTIAMSYFILRISSLRDYSAFCADGQCFGVRALRATGMIDGTIEDGARGEGGQAGKNHFQLHLNFEKMLIGLVFSLGIATVFFVFGFIISSVPFKPNTEAFIITTGIAFVTVGVYGTLDAYFGFRNRWGNIFGKDRGVGTGIREEGELKRGVLLRRLSETKNIMLLALGSGIVFGVLSVPCSVIVLIPAMVIVLNYGVPAFIGGVFMFIFGLCRGVVILPVIACEGIITRKRGRKLSKVLFFVSMVLGTVIALYGGYMVFECLLGG